MSVVPPADGSIFVSLNHLVRLEHRAQGLSFLPHQARRSVLAGKHSSRMRGRGLDFEEIRAYVPGDDLRTVDWKVTLRTGRPQVRAYTEERDRPMLLIVDQSMSMYFGSIRAMKSVIAAELAALMAWSVVNASDRVGAIVFDDLNISRMRPQRSRNHVHAILGAIAKANSGLRADTEININPKQLNKALETALALNTHDHMICVISDFAGINERTRQLLRELTAKNDVIAALVYDPTALDVKAGGRIVVTGGDLQIELDMGEHSPMRSSLHEHFATRMEGVHELLRRSGVPVMMFNTASDSADQLRQMLGRAPHAQASLGVNHG
jgi:uncharacterized protein (DUF58 family)